ncbi:hypothetical protein H6P81_019416 [Aristolochia fimbriata]|uniref:Glycosyltransferase n=1 Tax=Aristolochia fimbriata TaxID=158543 RepID=A0AAV7DST0_ARIFI|nr:hypothetical protein H6P81_019416 [Aristolochia fimbriata]
MAYPRSYSFSAKMSESPSEGSHVLMLPYLAKGHLKPFTALARMLADRTSFKITLISTPLNVHILRSFLPPDTPICFAELPFCSTDHGLPPGVENTSAAPPHLVRHLLPASGSLRPAFERLVRDTSTRREGRPPLCLITDGLMGWTVEIAKELGCQHYTFVIVGAYGIGRWTEMAENGLSSNESSIHTAIAYVLKQLCFSKESNGVLFNTVEELEAQALEIHRRKNWKRVWAIGPVLSPPPPSSASSLVLQWLDQHPKTSVLYVAFGSEVGTHPHQMMEIAKGLEASGKSFIWVIRPPIGHFDMKLNDDEDDFRSVEWLPAGFQERVTKQKNQGLLVKKWAPQFEILSHQSTAAFFTHCGWNSVLETLSNGVPVIGWPLAYDHPRNSRFMEEELGVGVEVARGTEAEIRGLEVERVIRLVMDRDSEKGAEMRRKAKRIKEEIIVAATVDEGTIKGSSIRAMEDFIQAMKQP